MRDWVEVANRPGTLRLDCCEPGRSPRLIRDLLLTRMEVGRLATGRGPLLISVVPEVLGRPPGSTWGRGPNFFFFGLTVAYDVTLLLHWLMLSDSAAER